MTLSLADLLTPQTEATIVSDQLALLASPVEGVGFPVRWWGVTSVPRRLVEADAATTAKLAAMVPLIAAGGFRSLAEGDWLDLKLESDYLLSRSPAVRCQRVLRLTDAGGGPTTLDPRTYWVSSAAGLRYVLVEAFGGGAMTVPGSAGHIDVVVEAELVGEAHNGSTAAWSWVTSVPGVTIADAPSGILVAGVEREQDGPYSQRAGDQWSTLGAGANDEAYRYHAKQSLVGSAFEGQITRCLVQEATPLPGIVTITVGSSATSGVDGALVWGTDSTAVQNLVQAYIDPPSHLGKAPNCVDVYVEIAAFQTISLGGVVTYTGTLAAAQAAVESALNRYAAGLPLGGAELPFVRIAKIIELVMDGAGVTNFVPSGVTSDVAVTARRQVCFDVSALTWTAA